MLPQSSAAAVSRRVGSINKQLDLAQELPHPLDPLAGEEILAAARACREYASASLDLPSIRFSSIAAKEPNKHEVLRFMSGAGARPARHALCVLLAPPLNCLIEALVDLDAPTPVVLSWKQMEGVQPPMNIDDVVDAELQLKKNPEFVQYLQQRYGITDLDAVACDPWYSGQRYGHPEGRIFQFILYLRSSPDDNFYAHPMDTVIFYDFHADKVIDFACYGSKEGQQIPSKDFNFHRSLMETPWRSGLKPLDVVQPEGPSFTVNGNEVSWQNWSFRVGFSWREGLILYNIGYEDGGRVRPIIYRAALAEIIVPYGEPRVPYDRKCAYDIVDYGLGFCANPLELGCDCLGHIKYWDAVLNNSRGGVQVIKKAVCMKEEDAGMAWKHMEYRNMTAEVRRGRRLNISFIATIANYEYAFYWMLYQDGTIQFDAKLTGIVSTGPLYPEELAAGGQPQHGVLVAPGVVGHHHQHFFNVRLDMALDDQQGGRALSVVEVDAEAMPLGPDNPHGIGFVTKETLLETEQQAQRMCAPERSRAWKIINPAVKHPTTGKPVAWKLVPTTSSPPMLAHPTSVHGSRGVFAAKHLWVTPYDESEMNPAGDYPLHPDPSQNQGIGQWTAKNRRVAEADVVVWYTFGLTHIVRPEDFPCMPVEIIGFQLKPFGFFEISPANDLPPIRNKASREYLEGRQGQGKGSANAAADEASGAACCAKPAQPAAVTAAAVSPLPRSKL